MPDAQQNRTKTSFHKRPLPEEHATAFSSKEGRKLFQESLQNNHMHGYFKLAEQFRTQDEPAYCGLSTLLMILNAGEVDPGQVWKGPWRWYHEGMLSCCRSLEEVKVGGLNFSEFVCLAQCHGLRVEPRIAVAGDSDSGGTNQSNHGEPPNCSTPLKCCEQGAQPLPGSLQEFRAAVVRACESVDFPYLAVSYSRKVFKQTGDGHFSPIAGYHKDSDRVLILDTARFKYPPHWVGVEDLYTAMGRVDGTTGLSRGWVTVEGKEEGAGGGYCALNGMEGSCECKGGDAVPTVVQEMVMKRKG